MAEATDAAVTLFYKCLTEGRPVVLGLTAARYCGKSRFVDECANALREALIPCAQADVESRDPETPKMLLDHLVGEFTAAPSSYGTVQFPRHLLAHLALQQKFDDPIRQRVEARMRALVTDTWLAGTLPSAAGDLAAAMAELHGMPGQAAGRMIKGATTGLLRSRPAVKVVRREGASWFADNPLLDFANSPEAGLARLWEWDRTPTTQPNHTELRNKAERVLAAAFVADLRSSAESGSWSGTYALLLDNGDHNDAAIRLVRYLVQNLGDNDRVTIAVTHRGRLLAEVGAVTGGKPTPDPARVPEAGPEVPPPDGVSWWPLRLPDLSEADIRSLLRARASWDESAFHRVAAAAYRCTRGHPGATKEVCDGLTGSAKPAGGHIDLRDILDADALRDKLAQGIGDAFEDLVTCAAVRDRDHVRALIGHGVAEDNQRALLREELWVPGRAQRLVLLPVLRRLLLERLAGRPDDAPNGWNTIFTGLAAHADDAGDEESLLYYRLSLGETETVVRDLYDRLVTGDPDTWIDLHKRITLAPGMFGGQPDTDVIARHKSWAAGEDPALTTLADLVVRLWLAADPLRPPADANAVKTAYNNLGLHVTPASAWLYVEAAKWGT